MNRLLCILGLILALVLSVSCSSDRDNEVLDSLTQSSETLEVNSTIESLKQFNDSLFVVPQARWSWKNFGRALAVSGADIIGAAAGIAANKELILVAGGTTGGTGAAVAAAVAGTICGAGASYVAYCDTEKSTVSNNGITVRRIMSEIPVGSFQRVVDDIDEASLPFVDCGVVHNIVLANVVGPPEDNHLQTANNYEYVVSELAKGNLSENKITPVYNEIISLLTPAIQNDYNYQTTLLEMKNKGMISGNLCKIYELFLEVYETYPKNQADIDFIVSWNNGICSVFIQRKNNG